MKKTLVLCLAAIIVSAIFVSCGNNDKTNNSDVKMFDGNISQNWTDVENDYSTIESETNDKDKNTDKVSKEEISSLIKTIKKDAAKLENGITKDNEDTAKELYKAGHRLELLGKKKSNLKDNEIVSLGSDAKALVRHYYGKAEEDYDVVQSRIKNKLSTVEAYGDKEWNDFISMF